MNGRHFHFVIDGLGPHIHGSAKDEGEPQHIVHLIGVVTPSGGHDDVWPRRLGFIIRDLRIRIGQSKHYGPFGHGGDHFSFHQATSAQAQKNICSFQGIRQILVGLGGMGQRLFARPQSLAAGMNVSFAVENGNVLQLNPQLHV